jgi:hypothetical protein
MEGKMDELCVWSVEICLMPSTQVLDIVGIVLPFIPSGVD